MPSMAKRKKKEPAGETPPPEPAKKRYPSRENTRYVAIPRALYEALERYAGDKSDEDETKSVSWAGRVAIRRFLTQEGYWPPPSDSSAS